MSLKGSLRSRKSMVCRSWAGGARTGRRLNSRASGIIIAFARMNKTLAIDLENGSAPLFSQVL